MDNQWICKNCYDVVFNELFKGNFTLQEALEIVTFIKAFEEDLKSYLLSFKKYAILNNEDLQETLNKIYKNESNISEDVFKVPRKVMTFNKRNHLKLINEVHNIEKLYELKDISNTFVTETSDTHLVNDLYKIYVQA